MSDALIHLRVPAEKKARWVRQSRAEGKRLTDWITEKVETDMKRTITQQEALQIVENDDADNLPYRTLNESGQMAVEEFINAYAAEPEGHNLDTWYTDAEQAANDAIPGEAVVIEMSGTHTATGNPETLVMDDEHFDWVING